MYSELKPIRPFPAASCRAMLWSVAWWDSFSEGWKQAIALCGSLAVVAGLIKTVFEIQKNRLETGALKAKQSQADQQSRIYIPSTEEIAKFSARRAFRTAAPFIILLVVAPIAAFLVISSQRLRDLDSRSADDVARAIPPRQSPSIGPTDDGIRLNADDVMGGWRITWEETNERTPADTSVVLGLLNLVQVIGLTNTTFRWTIEPSANYIGIRGELEAAQRFGPLSGRVRCTFEALSLDYLIGSCQNGQGESITHAEMMRGVVNLTP